MGNQAAPRLLRHGAIQPKLTVNQPGDRFEQEADRVADTVMRMPAPGGAANLVSGVASMGRVQRACAGGCSGGATSACEDCQSKSLDLQRAAEPASPIASVPAIVHDVLRSPGQPLDAASRGFFEPRFGRNFSQVRIHTDGAAAQSARDVRALAYTVGRQIVFAPGHYSPHTAHGQRLLAHELTHVVQQDASSGAHSLQRTCGDAAIRAKVGTRAGCTDNFDRTFLSGFPIFRFNVNCDDFAPTPTPQDTALTSFVAGLPSGATLEIHGFASSDGLRSFNENLGCARAMAAHRLITTPNPATGFAGISPGSITGVVNHGPVTSSSNPAEDLRSVVIRATTPRPIVTHRFRAAAWSFLSCAECNPFTDDGTLGVTPPTTEPPIPSSFRQMHFIEAELGTPDGRTIAPGTARLGAAGAGTGDSHFCSTTGKSPIVIRVPPGAPTLLPAGPHGEGIQFESETFSRVGVTVPPTVPGVPLPGLPLLARGAPCGPVGTNPAIPLIGNRFRMRLFADGTKESEFASATLYPSHNLYEDGALKTFGGSPVHPAIDFFTWAASTGVPIAASLVGFNALRFVCCHPFVFNAACDVACAGGFSMPGPSFSVTTCVPLLASIAASGCLTACAPAGGSCPSGPLAGPSNP